jgi:hypothetical protein
VEEKAREMRMGRDEEEKDIATVTQIRLILGVLNL